MRNQTICIVLVAAFMNTGIAFSQNVNHSQKHDSLSYIYLGFGGGPASGGYNHGLSANIIFENQWGYSIKYNSNRIIAKSLPNDYIEGLCFFGKCIPTDNYNSVSVHLLREMPTIHKAVRFGFEMGPSIGFYKKATFRIKPGGGGWFGSNYTTSYIEESALGLTLRAKGAFYLTTFTGIELAMVSIINQQQPFLGAEVYLLLGKVRKRQDPKTEF